MSSSPPRVAVANTLERHWFVARARAGNKNVLRGKKSSTVCREQNTPGSVCCLATFVFFMFEGVTYGFLPDMMLRVLTLLQPLAVILWGESGLTLYFS